MSYRVKTISDLTGIPRNTILAWERRHGLLDPARTPSGHRAYSDEDLRMLLRVKDLLDRGLRISEAVDRVRREGPVELVSPVDPSTDLRDALLDALLDFDQAAVDRLARRLTMYSYRRAIEEIHLPLLREVGERWAAGSASIAQEHYVSAFCRTHLVAMLHALESGPSNTGTVVCAGFPGETHELGLLAVSVLLSLRGMRVVYLGADLPLEEVSAVAIDQRADMVAQSVVLPWQPEDVKRHAEALRGELPSRTVLVLGGQGVQALVDESRSGLVYCGTFAELDEVFESGLRWVDRQVG